MVDGEWQKQMSLNEERYFAAILQLENSCFGGERFKQVVSGGMNHDQDSAPRYLNSIEVLTKNGWKKDVLPAMPVEIYSHCMVAINSTFLMVIGGFQVSISTIFYIHLFCTKVLCAVFLDWL